MFDDKVYDILDWLAENLPFLTIFWMAVGEIWNVPMYTEVGLTLTALAKLLQALVKKSAVIYYGEADE